MSDPTTILLARALDPTYKVATVFTGPVRTRRSSARDMLEAITVIWTPRGLQDAALGPTEFVSDTFVYCPWRYLPGGKVVRQSADTTKMESIHVGQHVRRLKAESMIGTTTRVARVVGAGAVEHALCEDTKTSVRIGVRLGNFTEVSMHVDEVPWLKFMCGNSTHKKVYQLHG